VRVVAAAALDLELLRNRLYQFVYSRKLERLTHVQLRHHQRERHAAAEQNKTETLIGPAETNKYQQPQNYFTYILLFVFKFSPKYFERALESRPGHGPKS
jgi:hypothetical protein